MMLKMWKRKNAEIARRWGILDIHKKSE